MKELDRTGDEKKPMIVFAGRSNVGKSSAIRVLTGKKVRVGKKPGSTRWEMMIDFGPITIVDIPGFGYMAGQSKTKIEETKTTIVQRLEYWRNKLIIAVLIIDLSLFRELYEKWSNRGEIPIDVEFYSFLSEISPNVVVVANKIDKIKKRALQNEVDFLQTKLEEVSSGKKPIIILTSAQKREGFSDLVSIIDNLLMKQGMDRPRWAIT
ncbi:MAG: GTP-binding protein EngB [Candidatus Thorarchaeota archaeon]